MAMTLTETEIKHLLTSPRAMRVLADYHDYQQTLADASDWGCHGNDARYKLFKAEAERIEAEWDAEREPEQQVFITQPAQAVAAWMTDDGRVISAQQKATAIKDGGASASSVAPYSIPLTRALAGEQAGREGCPACNGAQYITRVSGNEKCWRCDGEGTVSSALPTSPTPAKDQR